KRYPELFARGLVRHAGGVKEAWFVRTEEPFRRIYSREWCRGDPKDPAAITHRVECFSSRTTRQFGVDGPHTRERGVVIHAYSFAGVHRRPTRRESSSPCCRKRPSWRLATSSMRSRRRQDSQPSKQRGRRAMERRVSSTILRMTWCSKAT